MKGSSVQKSHRQRTDPHDYWSGVPTAPPLPSVEFLLGKSTGKRVQPRLPTNLKEELKQRMGWGRDAYDDNEDNEVDSVDDKPLSVQAQKSKQKRKKQLQTSEEKEDQQRAKKSFVSPRKPHKFERVPTPRPGLLMNFPMSDLPVPKRLNYEDAIPLPPPQVQKPSVSSTAKTPNEAALKPSRPAPKPPNVPSAPITKAVSARQKAGKQSGLQTTTTHSSQQQFMNSLNQVLARPGGVVPKVLNPSHHQTSPPDSPTSNEIENELLAMQLKVGSVNPRSLLQRQAAVEMADDSDDSSFTSSSDSSSETDDSSDESDHIVQARQSIPVFNTARPIMARNMGLHEARMARQTMQRMKNQRYPSILRKPIIKLGTITEIQDEVIYEKVSDAACLHHQVVVLIMRPSL